MARSDDPRTLGMRITERLLPFFGPAQRSRAEADGRGVSATERAREDELRTRFERVTGPDGRSYVVEHHDVDERADRGPHSPG